MTAKAKPGTYVAKEAKGLATGVVILVCLVGALVLAGPSLARGAGSAAVDGLTDGASDLATNSGDLATHLAPLTALGDGPFGPGGRYPASGETGPAAEPEASPSAGTTTAWTTPEPSAGDGVKARIRAIEPGDPDYPGPPEAQAAPKPESDGDWPRLGEEPSGGVLGAVPLVGPIVKELVAGGAVKALNP